MNNKPNNPPAFPLAMPDQYHPEGAPLQQGFVDSGMTLRDYFAAKAIRSQPTFPKNIFEALKWAIGLKYKTSSFCPNQWAKTCYKIADAMLAEREKGGQ